MCHREGNGSRHEITVANSAVPAHLAHGDNIGPCRSADKTKPTVTLTTPADGGTYGRAQTFNAAYTCADETGGSGIATCVGTTVNGAAIDTAALGAHRRPASRSRPSPPPTPSRRAR